MLSAWLRKNIYITTFCILILVFIRRDFYQPTGLFEDAFHYGEQVCITHSIPPDLPLTMHGLLDYVPAKLAFACFGPDRYFIPTFFLYTAFSLLACGLLLMTLKGFLKKNIHTSYWLIGVSLLLPAMISYRDLFLVAALYCYFRTEEGTATPHRWSMLLGLCLGMGLFWSFDRGLAGCTAFAPIALRQNHRGALVTGGVLGLGLLAVNPIFSLTHYLENLRFLMETASQWTYPWDADTLLFRSLLTMLYTWVAIALSVCCYRGIFQKKDAATIAFFVLLCIFTLRFSIGRPDPQHVLMGLWAPALCLFYCARRHPPLRTAWEQLGVIILSAILCTIIYKSYPYTKIKGLSCIGLLPTCLTLEKLRWAARYVVLTPLVYTILKVGVGLHANAFPWLHTTFPPNSALVTADLRWAAAALSAAKVSCVFDLTHSGLIEGLTQRPPCTRFAYLIYATGNYEQEILQTLQEKKPPVIVYSTKYWQQTLDNQTMAQRFPLLDNYIQKTYTFENCYLGYCIRYLEHFP